jgi:hypothetical protein
MFGEVKACGDIVILSFTSKHASLLCNQLLLREDAVDNDEGAPVRLGSCILLRYLHQAYLLSY